MSKVYLVLQHFPYEDTEVMKVFLKEEEALVFLANMERGRLTDDGRARKYGMSTVYIEEHEVEE